MTLLLPTAQLALCLLVLYGERRYGMPAAYPLLLAAAFALCGAGDIALLRAGARAQGRRMREEELRAARCGEEASRAYSELLGCNAARMRELCQGFSEELGAIKDAIECGEAPVFDEVESSLRTLEDETRTAYCANKTANAVLLLKAAECRRQDVAFGFEGEVPAGLSIEGTHLCSVFSNLLDNALTVACQTGAGEGRVKAACTVKGAYLVVEVANTCAADGGEHARESQAAAAGALREHGWGLQIVSELAERYEGRFSLEQSAPGEMLATAILKCVPRSGCQPV
ncbi:MAG: GHKL domain-containing protein [Coriobacteriales bacterium]